jgi:hypothetical protein
LLQSERRRGIRRQRGNNRLGHGRLDRFAQLRLRRRLAIVREQGVDRLGGPCGDLFVHRRVVDDAQPLLHALGDGVGHPLSGGGDAGGDLADGLGGRWRGEQVEGGDVERGQIQQIVDFDQTVDLHEALGGHIRPPELGIQPR